VGRSRQRRVPAPPGSFSATLLSPRLCLELAVYFLSRLDCPLFGIRNPTIFFSMFSYFWTSLLISGSVRLRMTSVFFRLGWTLFPSLYPSFSWCTGLVTAPGPLERSTVSLPIFIPGVSFFPSSVSPPAERFYRRAWVLLVYCKVFFRFAFGVFLFRVIQFQFLFLFLFPYLCFFFFS